jgi:hypothetical protein
VKNTAVRFIQEGAVLGNYLWVDTQVTTTVDKDLLKQCSNWIMGYQQERNEVTNVRENIGKHKITDEDIMSLKLGHFMASLQQDLYHVYVLPLGIDLEVGRAVALGKIRVEEVRDSLRMKSEGIIAPRAPKAPREVRPEDLEVFDPEELGKLRIQVTEISRKMIDQEEKYERELQELKQEKWELGEAVEAATGELSELKNEISSLKKDLEIRGAERDRLTQVVGSQDTELSQFRQFKVLLGQILEPLLVTDEELEEIREDLEKLKHQRPTRTRTAPVGDTGIAWIDVWLSKLGPAEQKILRFMAAKFPLKMTKSEIALGIGLTARGGYFSGAFNRLRKNKLIVEAGDGNWKLMEAPG